MAGAVDATFEIEVIQSTLLVRLNRSIERNPLSIATLKQLSASLPEWLAHDHIKAVIITRSAEVFASGANIRELTALDRNTAFEFAELGQNLMNLIAGARQKTIAAINGYCIGGGLDLALACQFRIASAKATFAHPGARLGIITGWGGTQRLPRLIGRSRALELLATGKTFNASKALDIGLIDSVADPVLDAALQLAVLTC